jgi:hypothetical protein
VPTSRHVGYAGEAAVASEFSIRGYTVSMPTIDFGNDLFVENHHTGQVWRVQVKTAQPKKEYANHFQFNVRENAIHNPTSTVSHFFFVMRLKQTWRMYIVGQQVLSHYINSKIMGTRSEMKGGTMITFTFVHHSTSDDVTSKGVSMKNHRDDWAPWPVLD